MSKVKLEVSEQTPSEQAVAKASAEVVITDAKGRAIKLKKPGVLAQFRMIEILGESAKNIVYTGMVLPLIFVAEIDGDAVLQPQSKRELEALIQRLDEDGVAAVTAGMNQYFGSSDPDGDREAVKK